LALSPGGKAFENDSIALGLLLKATEEDPSDALNWHYLGRLYLLLGQPAKAYDAYQQAVYRDGRNAAFWNSIGILYAGMAQFRDALDAYTRAVHHAPGNGVIWFNLHLLYESCNGSGCEDAREALSKARLYGFSAETAPRPLELEATNFVVRGCAAFGRVLSAGSRVSTKGQQQAAMRRITGGAIVGGRMMMMPMQVPVQVNNNNNNSRK
jgi:tetratricopeptide (TPR) repeat protein